MSLLATGSTLVACGDDDTASGELLVASDVARLPADEAAAREGAAAITALGADLYAIVSAEPGNVAVSPYSLAIALAMTRAGAAGSTAEEMDAVLHAELTADLHAALGSLDAALAQRPGTFPNPEGDPLTLELSFANAVWPQSGFPILDEYLAALAERYGAGVRVVDYIDDTEGARGAINRWVAEQTRDRIPELLPQGLLSTMTRLVLTNALYLNAPWLEPFIETATAEAPFHRADGTDVDVPFMHLSTGLAYGAGDGWQAVELPYIGRNLAMVVLVPDEGRLAEIEAGFGIDLLDLIGTTMEQRDVVLALPKWEFRTQLSLTDPLVEMGMPTAFSGGADFSGISPEQLSISDVIQEVFVSVDEKGTEAAAATAVAMEASAATEVVTLTVDRPYLFWVVDRPTGALLFLGRVSDPSAS